MTLVEYRTFIKNIYPDSFCVHTPDWLATQGSEKFWIISWNNTFVEWNTISKEFKTKRAAWKNAYEIIHLDMLRKLEQ